MADVPVEVKKTAPAQTNVPDVWQSFRSEMDRLFDRFGGGFGFPSLYGSFQRAFELPASVDRNKVAADFSKGVLTITLPKTAEAQKPAKKIEVKSS